MAMTHGKLESLIDRISWGGRFCAITTSSGLHFLILKELSPRDRAWIDFIYSNAMAEGKKNNLMSLHELAELLDSTGVWTAEDEQGLRQMKDALKAIEEQMELEGYTGHEKKKFSRTYETIKKNWLERRNQRDSLFSVALERHAEQEKIRAIVYVSTYTEQNIKYWPTWHDFLNEEDQELVEQIIEEILKFDSITTEQFRAVARSGTWRFKWNAAKSCDSLFGKPVTELTRNQETLVYWSQVYDSVYESYERPDDDIIEDDDKLDKWFENRAKERKRERIESGKSSKVKLSSRVTRHGEIGIVPSKNVSVEEIEELNSEYSKKFLEYQHKKLKETGVIKEQDLRASSDARRAINSTDAVVKKAKRRDGYTGKQVMATYQGGTLKGKRAE